MIEKLKYEPNKHYRLLLEYSTSNKNGDLPDLLSKYNIPLEEFTKIFTKWQWAKRLNIENNQKSLSNTESNISNTLLLMINSLCKGLEKKYKEIDIADNEELIKTITNFSKAVSEASKICAFNFETESNSQITDSELAELFVKDEEVREAVNLIRKKAGMQNNAHPPIF